MVDRSAGQKRTRGAQSIRRALDVLRALAAGRDSGVGLGDVVRSTGLSRPTAHRIVRVLIEEGLVERNARTGAYVIGGAIGELALARPTLSPLRAAADPVMTRVSLEVGDTLFLTVRTGPDTLCVDRRIGQHPIQVLAIGIGARRPLGVSSAGVAILAAMPSADAAKIVTANAIRFAAYKTDQRAVLAQIAMARSRGYCLREVGLIQGTKSISAWIKARDGQPAAALTVSAIRARLGPRREPELAECLRMAAAEIEQRIAAR